MENTEKNVVAIQILGIGISAKITGVGRLFSGARKAAYKSTLYASKKLAPVEKE